MGRQQKTVHCDHGMTSSYSVKEALGFGSCIKGDAGSLTGRVTFNQRLCGGSQKEGMQPPPNHHPARIKSYLRASLMEKNAFMANKMRLLKGLGITKNQRGKHLNLAGRYCCLENEYKRCLYLCQRMFGGRK